MTIVVVSLLILPLLLPWPLLLLEIQWIGPMIHEALLACASFYCPAATDLDQQGGQLVVGPSLLVASISLLLGLFGLIYTHWRPTSPKNTNLLTVSMICGFVWIVIFGCVLGVWNILSLTIS